MKKFIKENWFVVVIAVFFVGISIFYAYDQHKDDLPGKKVAGKDIVFSIDDNDVTADEVYDGLYDMYGNYLLTSIFTNSILDSQVETTDAISNELTNYVSYYTNLYQYYGGITYLNSMAESYGYTDFNEYMLYSIKSRELSAKYIENHADTYITDEFMSKYHPRSVSYCLVKWDDPANPTEDDKARLKAAQDAWTSDSYSAANFNEFAIAFSEDTSTASSGGRYGYIDSEDTSTDENFKTACLNLEVGEVSEWVFSDKFGYFLIKCDSTDFNDFKSDNSFVSRILTHYENAANEIVWFYAQEAGVKFTDEAVKDYILSELGVTESEAE